MVGFPGETEEDFEELYNFLKEAKFDKLGAFMYSTVKTRLSRGKRKLRKMLSDAEEKL